MPHAPQRPCRHPGCGGFAAPASRCCARHAPAAVAHEVAQREQLDALRGSAHERGYTSRWSTYARGFRARFPVSPGYLTRTALWTPELAREFHTLRARAAEQSQYSAFFRGLGSPYSVDTYGPGAAWLDRFPIFTFHPSRRPEPAEQVDHIIPISGPADPLFWQDWNHQAISERQHSEKTATHDGGFHGSKAFNNAPSGPDAGGAGTL